MTFLGTEELKWSLNFLFLNVLKTEIHQITEYTLSLYSTITTDWMLVLDLSHGRQN